MFNSKKHFVTKHLVVLLVLALSTSLLGFSPSESAVTGNDFSLDVDTNNEPGSEDQTYDRLEEISGGDAEQNDQTEKKDEMDDLKSPDTEQDAQETESVSDGNAEGDSAPDIEPEDEDPESELENIEDLEAELLLAANSQTVFNTLADLLKADIPTGTTVKTKGYASVGDGGASTYRIVDKPTVDELFAPKMVNKKYAQLVLSSTINVAQVGILPDNGISVLFQKLVVAAGNDKTVKTIKFNDGTYIIDKPVKLQSLNYKGTGKTILNISKKVVRSDNRMLYTRAENDSVSYTMNFSDLDFTMETCADHTAVDRNTVILGLEQIDGCKINNCHFKAYPSEKNGAFMIVDLVWFINSKKINNIEVSNSTFSNLTGEAYTGDPKDILKGGCLWFSGKGDPADCTIQNINIHDCEFTTTLTDEAFAVWQGKTSNVNCSNCYFENHAHDCHNIITFFDGTFKNTIVKNCEFVLNAPSTRVCKVMEVTGESKVEFDSLDFTFNSGVKDRQRNTYVFLTTKDSKHATGDCPTKVIIRNCTAKSNNGTGYAGFLGLQYNSVKTYEIIDCNVDVPFEDGLVSVKEVERNTIKITGNTINTHGKLMTIKISKYGKYLVDNNTIANDPGVNVNSSASIFYRFSNNNCTTSKKSALVNCNDLQKKHFIYYYNAGNKYKSGVKMTNFASNNKCKESDIIIKTKYKDGREINELIKKEYPGSHIEGLEVDNSGKKGSGDTPKEQSPSETLNEKAQENVSVEGTPETTETPKTAESQTEIPSSIIVDDITYTIGKDGNATVDSIGEVKSASINTVTVNGVEYPVTKIAAKACKGNKTIKKVTIGKNVKSIGKNAFKGCKKLKKVTIKANKALKVRKGAFKGLPDNAKIKIKGLKGKKKAKMIEAVQKRTNAVVE